MQLLPCHTVTLHRLTTPERTYTDTDIHSCDTYPKTRTTKRQSSDYTNTQVLHHMSERWHLSLLLNVLVLVDLEVAERVGVVGGSDDAEEVLKVVLLEVLLGEVLEVTLREGDRRGEDKLVAWGELVVLDGSKNGLTVVGNGDEVTKLAGLAVDLDAVVKELLESRTVEDVVGRGDRVVNVELVEGLASSGLGSGGSLGLGVRGC